MALSGFSGVLGGQRSRIRSSFDKELSRKHKPDYILLIVALFLMVIGLIVVYSIGPGLAAIKGVPENYYVTKQLIAIGLGLGGFVAAAFIPPLWWRKMVRPLIFLAILSVVAVAAFGQEVYGATRWVQVGGFSFQSAELIKFALLVGFADFLASRREAGLMSDKRKTFYIIIALLGLLGLIVAGVQSDLGSTAVMVAMIGIMSVLAGLPLKRVALVGAIIALGLALLIAIEPYRIARVSTFLHPTADCQDAGYQSCQALIAIGSGGVLGKGLGNSVQAYGYLPEAANDSIFAIFAEKTGFFGSALLVFLYIVFFSRMKKIIDYTSNDFLRFMAIGALAWLSSQTIINIGAMIGLLPLKGITLPLVSYGGTSLLFVMGALGVLFSISRYTGFTISPLKDQSDNNTGESYDNHGRRRGLRRPHYAQSRYR